VQHHFLIIHVLLVLLDFISINKVYVQLLILYVKIMILIMEHVKLVMMGLSLVGLIVYKGYQRYCHHSTHHHNIQLIQLIHHLQCLHSDLYLHLYKYQHQHQHHQQQQPHQMSIAKHSADISVSNATVVITSPKQVHVNNWIHYVRHRVK
jgi:hypothetical protein